MKPEKHKGETIEGTKSLGTGLLEKMLFYGRGWARARSKGGAKILSSELDLILPGGFDFQVEVRKSFFVVYRLRSDS